MRPETIRPFLQCTSLLMHCHFSALIYALTFPLKKTGSVKVTQKGHNGEKRSERCCEVHRKIAKVFCFKMSWYFLTTLNENARVEISFLLIVITVIICT